MRLRSWISLGTLIFLGLIIYFSRHEILRAWQLLDSVNIAILALLIPAQLIVYFAAGEMMFSYLRAKGLIGEVAPLKQARMALEMNFVNHALPSAGVSGMSYMTWRLSGYKVPAGRATLAQIIRYVAGFAAFITLLLVAVFMVTLDGSINRWIILLSGLIIFLMGGGTVAMIFLVSSPKRLERFSSWFAGLVNRLVRFVTFGRRLQVLRAEPIEAFFMEMHQDFLALRKERRILLKPYLWGLVFNLFDVMLFVITFWAFGVHVNPAPVLIAYGLASLAGFILVTPGGAGAYEAIMVAFLASAGVPADIAIAGTLLTRVILLLGTIGLGYAFYQHAIMRHGKPDPAP